MLPSLLALAAAVVAPQSADPLVSATWLAEHLNDRRVVVLHVDSRRDAYDEGHVPCTRFVALSEIDQRLDHPTMLLIDARPDNEYTGADGGRGGRSHPGHIPGAYVLGTTGPTRQQISVQLLPFESLRREFKAAGAGPDKTVVA